MADRGNPTEKLCEVFDDQKCHTIAEIHKLLDYSTISIRRFLKKVGYYSSFTHNSKWYILWTTPNFDRKGIWFYQDIGFSKHGNLTQTILYFVNNSGQGVTAKELFDYLSTPCHAILNQMYKRKQIDRSKTSRGFFYLSIDLLKRQKQFSKRIALPSDSEAVMILVEMMKHPAYTIAEIASCLSKKNVVCGVDAIERLLSHHGLKKKLKIPCKNPTDLPEETTYK